MHVASHEKQPDVRVMPRRFGRARLALFRTIERCSAALGGRAWYRARYLRAGRFIVREERIVVPQLPPDLDGYTIAQLSDLHAGSFLGAGDLRAVIAAVHACQPQAIVLTGDYITHRIEEAFALVDDLGQLRARDGVYAVFGNHDYNERRERELVDRLALHGVRFLRNDAVRISVGRATIAFTGLEDLEEGKIVDVQAARRTLLPTDIEVCLCHNPAGARRLARTGCAVILSGHTHGTQVDLPFLRRLGPKHPGVRVHMGPTVLIVSRGLGVVGIPWRVGAPSEVVLTRLCAS